MRARGFEIALVTATVVAVAFLALPLVALLTRTSVADLVAALGSDVALDALIVSLKTSVIAHVLVLIVGTPAAYLLGTRTFRGRNALVAITELPLVLPPVVAGIALLSAFGRSGLLGGSLSIVGLELPFTQVAVILAIAFVASPFYLRQAIAAFEGVDRQLVDAARTLGARPGRVFGRVVLPLAAGGLGAGSVLAFARGIGEFGATIIFAGSLQGRTQTLPLAIYGELDHDFDIAIAMSVVLVVLSVGAIAAVRMTGAWTPFVSTSRFRGGTSTSR
ncbi:MAG: ABC transporter permease [Actinomycetota bacterium]